MIERNNRHLSVRRQSVLLGADRGKLYRRQAGVKADDLELMHWMDQVSMEDPSAGARRCRDLLRLAGRRVSRKRLQRLQDSGLAKFGRRPRGCWVLGFLGGWVGAGVATS